MDGRNSRKIHAILPSSLKAADLAGSLILVFIELSFTVSLIIVAIEFNSTS
jgi:hypothetical protein